jgi:hypothetical protein
MSKFFGSSQVLYRGMRTRLRKSRTVHAAFRWQPFLSVKSYIFVKTENRIDNKRHNDKKADLIGPFESKKDLKMILLANNKLYLINLDFISQLKYYLLPFWTKRLKNKSIDYLLQRFNYSQIDYSEDFKIVLKKSKYWKHRLEIDKKNELVNLNFLHRKELNKYFEKLIKYLGSQRVSMS